MPGQSVTFSSYFTSKPHQSSALTQQEYYLLYCVCKAFLPIEVVLQIWLK